jgi:hypothetical protein
VSGYRPGWRRGLSLVEAVISVAIVGGMMVVALNAAGAAAVTSYRASAQLRGMALAQELMSEILMQDYGDPVQGGFGRGADETGGPGRSPFDDVDDYHGWTEAPPQERDGTPVAGFGDWQREVEVRWVNPANVALVRSFESGVKRITVSVRHRQVPVVRLVALRTAGAEAAR